MKEKIEKIGFAGTPQKVFRNIEHYRKVRAAILSALSNSRSSLRKGEPSSSYLINRLVVRFTADVDSEEIFVDYENGRIVLEAPKIPKQSSRDETDRRMYYYGNLIKSVEAIATIGITHIYLVLDVAGRQELESRQKKQRHGKPPRSSR